MRWYDIAVLVFVIGYCFYILLSQKKRGCCGNCKECQNCAQSTQLKK